MRILGLVPARGGSKRVPGKNLAEIGGRTLVRRALDAAVGSGVLDTVALSSDDEAILAEGRRVDGVLVVERPPELATDTATSLDAALHALSVAEASTGERYDALCLLQATTPFTEPEDVRAAVTLLDAHPEADSAVTVSEIDMVHHPVKLKQIVDGRLRPFLEPDGMRPSHELPRLYARNGAVYVTRRRLLDAGGFIAEDALAHVMPQTRSVDIDTPLDLEFARFLEARAGL